MKYRVHAIEDRNGTAVAILARFGGRKYTGTGLAKREPGDVRNSEVGLSLASARALNDLAIQLEEHAVVLVKGAEVEQARAKLSTVRRAQQKAVRRVEAGERLPLKVIKDLYGKEAARKARARREAEDRITETN